MDECNCEICQLFDPVRGHTKAERAKWEAAHRRNMHGRRWQLIRLTRIYMDRFRANALTDADADHFAAELDRVKQAHNTHALACGGCLL